MVKIANRLIFFGLILLCSSGFAGEKRYIRPGEKHKNAAAHVQYLVLAIKPGQEFLNTLKDTLEIFDGRYFDKLSLKLKIDARLEDYQQRIASKQRQLEQEERELTKIRNAREH
jgi:hypothetical protein